MARGLRQLGLFVPVEKPARRGRPPKKDAGMSYRARPAVLLISLARGLNRLMAVRGSRFEDRYHERVLGSPTQVRNTLKYVLENHAHHVRGAVVDEFSSGPWFEHWREGVRMPRDLPCTGPPTSAPQSWVLRGGWRRAGREI